MSSRTLGRLTHRVQERMRHKNLAKTLEKAYQLIPGYEPDVTKMNKVIRILRYMDFLTEAVDLMAATGIMRSTSAEGTENAAENEVEMKIPSAFPQVDGYDILGEILLEKFRNCFAEMIDSEEGSFKKRQKRKSTVDSEEESNSDEAEVPVVMLLTASDVLDVESMDSEIFTMHLVTPLNLINPVKVEPLTSVPERQAEGVYVSLSCD